MKILIVDDNTNNRRILKHLIESYCHEVIETKDEQEGLEKAVIYKPDMIIANTLMPKMGGFQFLKNTKKITTLKPIPIVFYSGVCTDDTGRKPATLLGAEACIIKPLEIDMMWSDLKTIIEGIKPESEWFGRRMLEHEEKFLKNYSQVVATKLKEKVKELEKNVTACKQTEVKLAQQTAVAELGNRALTDVSLSALMDEVVAVVVKTLGVEYCGIFERLTDDNTLILRSGAGWKEGLVGNATVSADRNSQAGYTLLSHAPVILEDIHTERRFQCSPLLFNHSIVSGTSVIINTRHSPFGVLGAYTAERLAFHENDIHFLQAVANVLAMSIERKRMEELLRKSETRLAEAQQIAHIGNWEWNLDTNDIYWSDEIYRIFGLTLQEFRATYATFLAFVHPEDRAVVEKTIGEAIHEKRPYNLEFRILRKDATVRTVHARGIVAFDDGGKAFRMAGTLQDITECKRTRIEVNLLKAISIEIAEAKTCRAALEVVVRKVCEATGWIYGEAWIPSPDGKSLECCLTYSGGSEELKAFGKKTRAYTFPRGVGLPGRVWSSKKPEWRKDATIDGDFPRADIAREFDLKAAMGIPVIAQDEVIAVLGFFVQEQREEDERLISLVTSVATQLGVIIQRKRAEEEKNKLKEQLYHAQRLESVGKLAGGVAHNFNNILMVITGYGHLLQLEMEKDVVLNSYIQNIIASTERGAHLTQGLLAFSRKQTHLPKLVTLNEVVKRTENLLSKLIGEDIVLKITLTDKDLTILADSLQIEQVLMNLATNAKDAMPEGGVLAITTDFADMNDEFIGIHGFGERGRYALITVADTGIGMDGKTKERIFEPFFTTKEVGKGTGLGLSVVYGIVKQHEGYVAVDSEPGKGTTFRIYLPIKESKVEKVKPEELPAPAGGTETILVAEDEEEVRKLIKTVLEGYGYTVIAAVNGTDAIKKFSENKDTIQLLVLDVIMPAKGGKEVYETAKKTKADIKAIFISGYCEDIIHRKEVATKGLNFISKPVSPLVLLTKIREALDKVS